MMVLNKAMHQAIKSRINGNIIINETRLIEELLLEAETQMNKIPSIPSPAKISIHMRYYKLLEMEIHKKNV